MRPAPVRLTLPALRAPTLQLRARRRAMAAPAHTVPRASAAAAAGATATAAYVAYYLLRCRLPGRIRAGATALNAAVLARTPSLHAPYTPPFWAANAWVQLVIFIIRTRALPRSPPFRRQKLVAPDGGTVALDWLDENEAPLPASAPLLLILHTITGTSRDFLVLARAARARGFRPVVCVRRGHLGEALTAPRVNLLGCTADLRQQLAAAQAAYPDAPVTMIGASAGTGLLVRYLGEEGSAARGRIAGAVAVCPGYDTSEGGAFSRFAPALDAHLLAVCKKFFLRSRNDAVLANVPGIAELRAARGIAEYQRRAYQLEGYASVDEMHKHTNPMGVAAAIRAPLLVINAADDPVCHVSNVHDNAALFDEPHDRMLLLTDRGSHCTFLEGVLWPRQVSWADRVALDYLQTVLALRAEEQAAAPAEAEPALAVGK